MGVGSPSRVVTKADSLQKHFHEPDVQAAGFLYAAVAAHDLKGKPVWPMAVAPPSSMKTEIIAALNDLPFVHSIDGFTSKTFISGQIRDKSSRAKPEPASSLLHRIGPSGILLCPDFSTVLAVKADDRNAIFADLRRIYDGELKKVRHVRCRSALERTHYGNHGGDTGHRPQVCGDSKLRRRFFDD